MKWWHPDRPDWVLSLPQCLLQDGGPNCTWFTHLGREAVGDLKPLTKKNLPLLFINAWNNFAKVIPGGRVKRGRGRAKLRNAKTTPLFLHVQTCSSRRQGHLRRSDVGLSVGLRPKWTNSRDGLSLNNCEALYTVRKTMPPWKSCSFLVACYISYSLKTLTWNGLAIPAWPLSTLQAPFPLFQSPLLSYLVLLKQWL